jgi:hypothetical protein
MHSAHFHFPEMTERSREKAKLLFLVCRFHGLSIRGGFSGFEASLARARVFSGQIPLGAVLQGALVLHVRDYTMRGMGKDTVPGCGGCAYRRGV